MAYGKTIRAIEPTPLKFFGGSGESQAEIDEQNARDNFEQMIANYEATEIKNPYAGISNTFSDVRSTAGMLGVNTQQAQFEQQQATANQAQMLNQLRGAAGSSGVASLAQAMANQQALNTQRIAAGIGSQESAISQQRAQMEMAAQTQRAQGAMQAQLARAGGAATQQQLQLGQQTNLINLAAEQYSAASDAVQQEEAERAALYGGVGSVLGAVAGSFLGSPTIGASIGGTIGSSLA
tara:strand:- start:325 stop:1035 length:711 start_codon:yes stop_codon:yes gene_type:complete